MDMNSMEIGWNNGYKAAIKERKDRLNKYKDDCFYLVDFIISSDIPVEDKKAVLLYIRELDDRIERIVDDWLEENGYCVWCGEKLKEISYQEYHPEIDAYEVIYGLHCPNDCF